MNLITRFASLFLCWTLIVHPGFAQPSTPTPYPDFLFDHDQDGDVDSQDLLLFLQKWGIQGIATPTPTHTHTPTISPTETPTLSPTETPTNPDILNVGLPGPFIKMVRIPAGSFLMGSPDTERSRDADEGPVHQVTIGYDFYLGETEVTQSQWEAVMGSNPASGFGVDHDYPVYNVSWDDCQAFLAALNTLGQGIFRLPSEAEWEYACRAGTTTRFYFGDSLGCADGCEDCLAAKGIIFLPLRSSFMWYCGNNEGNAHPVRLLYPNGFGLFDMAGNVFEWCQDSYHADYTGAPIDGSAWESPVSDSRVIRVGYWLNSARDCRSANRNDNPPDFRYSNVGLRVARTASP